MSVLSPSAVCLACGDSGCSFLSETVKVTWSNWVKLDSVRRTEPLSWTRHAGHQIQYCTPLGHEQYTCQGFSRYVSHRQIPGIIRYHIKQPYKEQLKADIINRTQTVSSAPSPVTHPLSELVCPSWRSQYGWFLWRGPEGPEAPSCLSKHGTAVHKDAYCVPASACVWVWMKVCIFRGSSCTGFPDHRDTYIPLVRHIDAVFCSTFFCCALEDHLDGSAFLTWNIHPPTEYDQGTEKEGRLVLWEKERWRCCWWQWFERRSGFNNRFYSQQMEGWPQGYSSVSQWNLISDYTPPSLQKHKRITCGYMNNENEIISGTCI